MKQYGSAVKLDIVVYKNSGESWGESWGRPLLYKYPVRVGIEDLAESRGNSEQNVGQLTERDQRLIVEENKS